MAAGIDVPKISPESVARQAVNPAKARYGIPDIGVAPTLHDWLTGQDPVLARALDYGWSHEP